MKRTKKPDDGRIWWKNTGGGSHYLGNRILKPGQKFKAHSADIPEAIRDKVVPLSDIPAIPEENFKAIKTEYSLKHRSGAWYDVVDGNKKVINEKALTRVKALELIQCL